MATKKDVAVQAVAQTYADLDRTLDALTETELLRASSNEGWSGKDTLAHLSTIEERTQGQIRCALEGGSWNPPEVIDAYNARQVAARRGWSVKQLRDELRDQHEATLSLLRTASESDFDKAFDHPRWGRTTLEALCTHIAQHVGMHASEIAAVRAG
ncbi:MAG TPA: DinB family protein [Chloroflexota bacterium]|nr:DinB family protein [Chloroflexota bacterium]